MQEWQSSSNILFMSAIAASDNGNCVGCWCRQQSHRNLHFDMPAYDVKSVIVLFSAVAAVSLPLQIFTQRRYIFSIIMCQSEMKGAVLILCVCFFHSEKNILVRISARSELSHTQCQSQRSSKIYSNWNGLPSTKALIALDVQFLSLFHRCVHWKQNNSLCKRYKNGKSDSLKADVYE